MSEEGLKLTTNTYQIAYNEATKNLWLKIN